jgi:hypothetical protein
MLSDDFLGDVRRATEAKWSENPINPTLYGFQFQRGTRWNPGLSDELIAAYQDVLGVRFPRDFHVFLRAMNGTDLPTLNVYGYCGEPLRESVGVYSYPRDLQLVQHLMSEVQTHRQTLTTTTAEEGFDLPLAANLVPIYGHRYVVCTSDLDSSVVLSIHGNDDAIVYGKSLQEYLEREFLLTEGGSCR